MKILKKMRRKNKNIKKFKNRKHNRLVMQWVNLCMMVGLTILKRNWSKNKKKLIGSSKIGKICKKVSFWGN